MLVVVGVGYLVGLVKYLEIDIDVFGLLCELLEVVLKKCNIFWIMLIILVVVL
ncbi:conjugal transfer protein TraB, partial [Xanthomonas citri pv. citri]|nr:conjugal transfer protein TraB [Xanthomonas citri pv. citri]